MRRKHFFVGGMWEKTPSELEDLMEAEEKLKGLGNTTPERPPPSPTSTPPNPEVEPNLEKLKGLGNTTPERPPQIGRAHV